MFENEWKIIRITTMLNQDRVKRLYTDNQYNEYLESNDRSNGGVGELVGDSTKQVKPYFDFDAIDIPFGDTEKKLLRNWMKETYDMNVSFMSRPSRDINGKTKNSVRMYVQDYRISQCLIPVYFKDLFIKYDGIIDSGVYNPGRVMLTYGNKFKINTDVTPLEMDNPNENMTNVFATYIEENYINLDDCVDAKVRDELYAKVMKKKEDKERDKELDKELPKVQYNKIIKEDEDDINNGKTFEFIEDIIKYLNPKRATDYKDWSNVCFAIFGACKKSKISKRKCLELIHSFSQLDTDKYNEDKVDDWVDKNYNKQMERTDKQYGYNYLIHTCLKEDNLDYYDDTFNKTYKKIKEEFEKEVIKVNDSSRFIQFNYNRDIHKPECFYVKDKKELIHYYIDVSQFIYTKVSKDKKGNINKEKISIVDTKSDWWKDCDKKKVDRLIFQPSQLNETMQKKYYNMFQGFRVQFLPINKDYVRIQRILNHIKEVICNDNEYSNNWFLNYLSGILKGRKTNVFPMIRGLEGCGKNIILDMFAYGIIGEDYAIASSSPEKQLFGNFNSLLQNRVFTIINEGSNGLRNCIDTIKDLVTAEKVNIEKKGIDATTLCNYNNFIGNTNNFNILNVSATDRRFVWFNCNNKYCGDMEYFNPLIEDVKNPQILSALYHYLIDEVNCPDDYDFQITRPKTAIYKKLQQINLPNPINYLCCNADNKELLQWRKYNSIEYTTIKCYKLYDDYKCWATSKKYETYSYQAFESKITDDNTLGITKVIDSHRFKVFKFNKQLFYDKIKTYDDLEGLEVMEDDGFTYSDDED